jgi:hypothetical protein
MYYIPITCKYYCFEHGCLLQAGQHRSLIATELESRVLGGFLRGIVNERSTVPDVFGYALLRRCASVRNVINAITSVRRWQYRQATSIDHYSTTIEIASSSRCHKQGNTSHLRLLSRTLSRNIVPSESFWISSLSFGHGRKHRGCHLTLEETCELSA